MAIRIQVTILVLFCRVHLFFFFSSRRRHTILVSDWSSDVCSSDLAALEPQWRDGSLAFVHACGSPDPTRSHFDAQDYMESGTPGIKSTGDGWMNRVQIGRASCRERV